MKKANTVIVSVCPECGQSHRYDKNVKQFNGKPKEAIGLRVFICPNTHKMFQGVIR